MPKLALLLNFRKKREKNKKGTKRQLGQACHPTLTSASFLYRNTTPFLGCEKAKMQCNTKVNLLYDNPK